MTKEEYKKLLEDSKEYCEEDIDSLTSAIGIEIRIMYDDCDEHEGYYDTIAEAIEALRKLQDRYPYL